MKLARFLLRIAIALVVIFVIIAYVMPVALRAFALKGPDIAASVSMVSPKAGIWLNGQVFAARQNPLLFPQGIQQVPTSQKVSNAFDFLSEWLPGVAASLVAIFGNRHILILVGGIALLITGIVLLRRQGVGGIFGKLSKQVSTPLGLVTFLFGLLLIGSFVWAAFIGWEAVILAIRPIVPLAVIIMLGILFWEVIKKAITALVMGGLFLILLLEGWVLIDPDVATLPWLSKSPALASLASVGASYSLSQSKNTIFALTLIVLVVVLVSVISQMRKKEGIR